MSYSVKINTGGMDKFAEQLKNAYVVVGVMGSKDEKGSITEYAYAHEFGSIKNNLPRRSFLKDPLEKHLPKGVKRIKKTLTKLIVEGRIDEALEILGMKGVEIVKKAFQTSNDGEWKELAPATIRAMSKKRRKGWKILVDTGDLVGSITSKVIKE